MPTSTETEAPRIAGYQVHTPPLGEGSYGVVYRATYRGISDRAIKVFKPKRVDLATVARELEKLSSVAEHPGIVTLHDFDLTADKPYYAMGLHARETDQHTWSGRTLEDLCGIVDSREALRLIREIADALAYLHRAQIIHCDIKPSNVLLTDETPPRVKICDFGQSRGTGFETFEPAGTPYYAPPEQLRAPQDSGEGKAFKWDVYSFGALAYKLITGKLPRLQGLSDLVTNNVDLDATILDASAEESIVESVTGSNRVEAGNLAGMIEHLPEITWPGKIARSKTVDIELKAVIEKCLSLDPADRFADMRETAGVIEEIIRKKSVKRAQRLIGTFAALATVALAATGFAFVQMKAARDASLAEKKSRAAAEELVQFILFDLGEKLRGIDRMELLEHVAENAETYFAGLADDKPTVQNLQALAVILNNKGDVAFKKGDYDDAAEQYAKAYNIAFQLLENNVESNVLRHHASDSLLHMGDVHLAQGMHDEALVDYKEALALRREAIDLSGETGVSRSLIECLTRLAQAHRLMGDSEKALDFFNETLSLMRGDAGQKRSSRPSQKAGSRGLFAPGKFRAGKFGPPSQIRSVDPKMAWTLEAVGDIHTENRDFVEAANSYQESLAIYSNIAANDRRSDLQERLASLTSKLGRVYLALGNRVDAQFHLLEGLRLRKSLAATDPNNIEWQLNIAEVYLDLGATTNLEDAGANLTALSYYRKALDLLENLEPDEAAVAQRKDSLTTRVESNIADVIGAQLGED